MLLMFFAFKDRKASFIFKTFSALLLVLEACTYDLFLSLLFLVGVIGLKYLDISFTSFSDFTGIRKEILLILAGLSVFFSPFLLFFSEITSGGEFGSYLLPKAVFIIVSNKQVLFRIIDE